MRHFKTFRFSPAWLATVLTVCGCSPRVDDSVIINTIRSTDSQFIKFLDVFPNATASLDTVGPGMKGIPDPLSKRRFIKVRNKGADGNTISMARELTVDSDGVAFEFSRAWSYRLGVPGVTTISLTKPEFDALLAARGKIGSLKPFGKDFSLSPMDESKVIERVRDSYPPARKLHEVFPEASTKVDKKPFEQLGRFSSSAGLDGGYQLSVSHAIRVATDGIGVELVGQPTDDLGKLRLYNSSIPFAGPIDPIDDDIDASIMILKPEQFDRILAAKGAPEVVQQVWTQRSSVPKKP